MPITKCILYNNNLVAVASVSDIATPVGIVANIKIADTQCIQIERLLYFSTAILND
jgi:hypothetical protein